MTCKNIGKFLVDFTSDFVYRNTMSLQEWSIHQKSQFSKAAFAIYIAQWSPTLLELPLLELPLLECASLLQERKGENSSIGTIQQGNEQLQKANKKVYIEWQEGGWEWYGPSLEMIQESAMASRQPHTNKIIK